MVACRFLHRKGNFNCVSNRLATYGKLDAMALQPGFASDFATRVGNPRFKRLISNIV
jgi:hypothetical protein